jgi:hypothetical protein
MCTNFLSLQKLQNFIVITDNENTLHKDSRISFVKDEIIRMTNRYLLNLTGHSNEQVNPSRPEEDYTDGGPQMCYNKRQ